MRLRIPGEAATTLFALIRNLNELGRCPVLIGGQVPSLLLQELDPEGFESAPDPRATSDCDLAIDIAIDARDEWAEVEALCDSQHLRRNLRENQFRREHPSGLLLDLVPVPTGIERGATEAVAFAKSFVERDTKTFYRGYELALEQHLEIPVEALPGQEHPLRIADLPALLAMKLQAWTDRRFERKRDAHDIGWLLRYLSPDLAAEKLHAARRTRPDLVTEIIQRLEKHFADPYHKGIADYVSQAHPHYYGEEDRHSYAVATQIGEMLRRYRQRM